MQHKIIVSIIVILSYFCLNASAQQYSLYEAKKMKEGHALLSKKPHLWFGKASHKGPMIKADSSDSTQPSKKACQYAAIKTLAELQKTAYKNNAVIVKNIHSPGAKPGFYYCAVKNGTAYVELRGTLANK